MALDVASPRSRLAALREALSAGFAAGAQAPELARGAAAARARRLVPRRRTVGMPFSQARIPPEERMPGNYEQALNWMDGRRNLWEIAERVRWDGGGSTDDAWLEPFIGYCELLARYGYLEFV